MTESSSPADKPKGTPSGLLYTYTLAAIGFGFMIGWDVFGLYAPALPLLAFVDITQAFVLSFLGVCAMSISYVVYSHFASQALARYRLLAITATICGQGVVICAAIHLIGPLPLAVDMIAWLLFGFSKATICMVWCVFLSSLPTRRTGVSIGAGGVLGSIAFLAVSLTQPALITLIGVSALCILSVLVLFVLFRGSVDEVPLDDESYRNTRSTLSKSAALSSGAQGAIYGFITFYVCLLGSQTAIIVGASGIVGCICVVIIMFIAPKASFDNGIVQRISQPVIVLGLVLLPFLAVEQRIICGVLVNVALAFANIATWCTVAVENREFRLQPILRFSTRQAPLWIGFIVGALITTIFGSSLNEPSGPLGIIVIILVVFLAIAFSVYGANDSEAKRQLEDLMLMDGGSSEGELSQGKAARAAAPIDAGSEDSFNERCARVCDEFGLSPREREVFLMLAKGRNAKIIQEELCVSASTVKTHIYRIYRKMGINSQQLLIDTIDRRNPSEGLPR
ncbi:MAG: helix-turn-helix transcriptional regulator [Coriobacteriales bacterium]